MSYDVTEVILADLMHERVARAPTDSYLRDEGDAYNSYASKEQLINS